MEDHKMRRKDRQLSREEAITLLEQCEYGILATADKDGAPYAVPLSYVYQDGRIYFHCAIQGHKLDNMAANSRVSFCVVTDTKPVYVTDFTTYYKSVVVFGQARLVEEVEEKTAALRGLCMKYLPDSADKIESNIEKYNKRTLVYAVEAEVISGKANIKK